MSTLLLDPSALDLAYRAEAEACARRGLKRLRVASQRLFEYGAQVAHEVEGVLCDVEGANYAGATGSVELDAELDAALSALRLSLSLETSR